MDPSDEYLPSTKPTTYPFNVTVKGKEYTIIKTESYRFMTQNITVNEEGSEIDDGGAIETVQVSARIKLYLTDTGMHIIEIKDEVFFPEKIYWVVELPGYIYDKYSDAMSILRRMGYEDLFKENRTPEKVMAEYTKNRKTRLIDWWIDRRWSV